MSKHTNRFPPALKHGIYSGIGLLPTEDPAEFQKFKQATFDELAPVGRVNRLFAVAPAKFVHLWPGKSRARAT